MPIVLSLAALAACTQDPPSALPSPPATAIDTAASLKPSPSTTPKPAPPALPPEARQPTTRGAAAFFRYFFALYDYGFQTLDSQPLERVSLDSCGFCRNTIKAIDQANRLGLNYSGGQVTVKVAVAAPGNASRGLILNALIDQRAGVTRDNSGAEKRKSPASVDQRMDAGLRWDGKTWKIFALAVLTHGDS